MGQVNLKNTTVTKASIGVSVIRLENSQNIMYSYKLLLKQVIITIKFINLRQ